MTSDLVLITDTHFNHRPPTGRFTLRTEEDDLRMFEGLVKFSGPSRVLVHLGDVVFGLNKDATLNRFISPLQYRSKILILGNHDVKGVDWYYQWFDLVVESLVLKVGKKRVLFSHRPVAPLLGVDLNVHGHFHDNDHRHEEDGWAMDNTSYKLLAIERTGLQPVMLEEFVNG